jgi:hypothetical protein
MINSNHLSDNSLIETPEEKEVFDRISREQQIDAIASVVRTCPTTSSTGIAVLLVEAGCSIDLLSIQK